MTKDNNDNFMSKDNVAGSLDALNKHVSKDNSDDGLVDEICNIIDFYGIHDTRLNEIRITENGVNEIIAKVRQHKQSEWVSFQERVQPWLMECFGEMIAGDKEERNHRFLEESLELVQACGCTSGESHQLVDYVFNRDVGEKSQEVGGVMVTLAALCLAQNLNMHKDGETELSRISIPEIVLKIRTKQAAKPKYSPLPED